MRVCTKCTLSENISSVRINDEGLCNYCLQRNKHAHKESIEDYAAIESQLADAFNKYPDRQYQIVLAYSGGKDSTFTLFKLREIFNVSVLAVTFDNGFITEQCRQNIHTSTAYLGVDSITVKPAFSKLARAFNLAATTEIYPKKALERASSICTACIGIVKSIVYHEAMLRRVPFVCFGWTPGQVQLKSPIMKLDYRMILANQNQIQKPLVQHLGHEFDQYFMEPAWISEHKDDVPYLAYPLALSKYNEDEILETIQKIGWKRPQDTDMNSTNCLLNSYANAMHCQQYGYNPYSLEIAGLVREGFISREEGLKKLAIAGEESVIAYVKNELQKYL